MEALLSMLPTFQMSRWVPLVLLVILGGSSTIFMLLLRRWTTQRRWVALADWASLQAFRICGEARAAMPEVVGELTDPPPRVLISLAGRETTIVQIESAGGGVDRWNLLIRKLETSWPMTCLRPTSSQQSAFDFLPVAEMHAISLGERFVLYSKQSSVTRALAHSSVAALLPANVGLGLIGQNLILDFSSRPFDAIEMQRLLVVAEQVLAHLPVVW